VIVGSSRSESGPESPGVAVDDFVSDSVGVSTGLSVSESESVFESDSIREPVAESVEDSVYDARSVANAEAASVFVCVARLLAEKVDLAGVTDTLAVAVAKGTQPFVSGRPYALGSTLHKLLPTLMSKAPQIPCAAVTHCHELAHAEIVTPKTV
jgi:hypothetical protein